MKLAIITDSGANLTPDYVKKHKNLRVIPLMIIINGKSYLDGVDITISEIYAQLDSTKISTSLPALEDLEALLTELKGAGYTDVLVINISSGMSGTYNAFSLFFKDYQGLTIHHYDSKTLAGAQGFLAIHAVKLATEGRSAAEIVTVLDQLRYHDCLPLFTINTLKYLKRGGRIGKVEGTIGEILHIKPVITVNDEGIYFTHSKAFGFARALLSIRKSLLEKYGTTPVDLILHYGDDLAEAEALAAKLKIELNVKTLIISQLTPVLGIHTGPSIVAVIAAKAT